MPNVANLTSDRLTVGNRIKALRTARGWSQRRLAVEINASGYSAVHHWESGNQFPSLPMAARLAMAFGVTIDELVEGVTW